MCVPWASSRRLAPFVIIEAFARGEVRRGVGFGFDNDWLEGFSRLVVSLGAVIGIFFGASFSIMGGFAILSLGAVVIFFLR